MLLTTPTVRDLERLTARVTSTRATGARLDAYREDDTFHIDIDLPGVDPASIDITVDGRVLTVRAERGRAEREGVRYLIAERPVGPVSRQVHLSEKLDTDRLEARHDNGVLTLSIPVLEERKPRRIEVAVAG
ncbi:heat shock protein Hsp20 [Actinoplanes sp. SE50]|uniref:Hsp20/alpha crystallin family protein n=1 Tax=unclassified Actinoplanes TaxID=2626549 RepID=UPI00023ECF5C|nr:MULTISPECIES: Hsp20/alpha crystallin family protein [unclassified Actinoplanes]AEV87772.1 18.5 kDa class I heat shock protein [Actinoplanes sp. SE50/110]ATO86174.1 heat shock protein Hsp20 [Actinoplanes sp. SE50]SLM03588.1 heat-shock protein Hsp20 [Actinoplanes sp. SE50/110]